jgi:hypothetical protein
MRTEAFLRPTIRNIRRPYIHINTQEGDLISSTLAFPSLPLPFTFTSTFPQCSTMEPVRRMDAGGIWDRPLEEIISLIAVKVVETSEALLKDLHSLWRCNKAMKRASSRHTVANCFNLEHHYQSMVWGDADELDAYLQTVDWLQGVNNRGALFIKGMGDICTG